MRAWASFLRDQRGAIQVEYALIAALVGAAPASAERARRRDGRRYQPIVHSGATQCTPAGATG